MLKNIGTSLRYLLYNVILGKPVTLNIRVEKPPAPSGIQKGAQGPLAVDALLVRDTDRGKLILVVDTDLNDVPVWADWDQTQNMIGIAQQNGAYATLKMEIEKTHQDELKPMTKIMIVTKIDDMNIVHQIPFMVRDY